MNFRIISNVDIVRYKHAPELSRACNRTCKLVLCMVTAKVDVSTGRDLNNFRA